MGIGSFLSDVGAGIASGIGYVTGSTAMRETIEEGQKKMHALQTAQEAKELKRAKFDLALNEIVNKKKVREERSSACGLAALEHMRANLANNKLKDLANRRERFGGNPISIE